MWDYTDKVNDHFLHPRNVGEIENADARAMIGNIACGDALLLTLKIDKDTDTITDAKFKTFGCASAIASSSVLTELIKNKTVDEASKVTNKEIADELGGLPEEKMHCSVMGMEALEKAIAEYRGIEIVEDDHDDGKIICGCFGVTDTKIERAIKENNLTTIDEVVHYTKAGGACAACKPKIEDILNKILATGSVTTASVKQESSTTIANAPMTTVQKIKKIEEVIETVINPMLQNDGGQCSLVDIDGNVVKISLTGRCSVCKAATQTIKLFIEPKLKELVSSDIVVEL